MNEQQVFPLADRTLAALVSQIPDDQWERDVPEGMRWGDHIRSLRDLVNHHARDDAWVPDVLAGRTLAEVGDQHDGDLLGATPSANFDRLVEAAVTAVADLADLDRIVHLSYGDFPARDYLLHVTIFRGFGAYDIATFAGVDAHLPAELVQGLAGLVAPHAETLRAWGVFGPEVLVPPEASPQDRLLGLSGRDPAE